MTVRVAGWGRRVADRAVLVLGGTAEARQAANRLNDVPGISVTTSLAGVTRNPRLPAGAVRRGGFGGVDGLAAYLKETRTTVLLDATHPYAVAISRNAAAAGRRTGVPVLHLVRPAWERQAGDVWHVVDDAEAAAAWLQQSGLADGATVFLTVARHELAAFAGVTRFRYLVRTVEPVSTGSLRAETLQARGPFQRAGERALMRERGVACLVSRNSGGDAGVAKIEAARDLGVPVVMLRRPDPPAGETAESVSAAVSWVGRVARAGRVASADHSRSGRNR